jgi:hypothetical protein
MQRDYIAIKKSLIPYNFNITLAGETFNFSIKYNELANMFTVDLKKKDGTVLCYGEPVCYGKPLFDNIRTTDDFPLMQIVPFDESGATDAVTWDNFNETVHLVIDNWSDEIE